MPEPELKKQPVIILAYFFPPRNAAGAARPHRFHKYLRRLGYVSKVICDGAWTAAEACSDVIPVPGGQPASGFTRLIAICLRLLERVFLSKTYHLAWTAYAFEAARRVMIKEGACAVLSTFPPLSTHLAALLLQRAYGARWIADFRDPLSDDAGPRYKNRRLREFMEGMVFKYADVVIANTEGAGEMFRRRYPQQADKIQVIWNGFDPEDRMDPLPISVGDRRVLLQTGDIYSFRHPGRLLLALERLKSQDPPRLRELAVQLFGEVDRPWNGMDDAVVARLLENNWVQCHHKRIPQDEARRRTGAAHYLLLCDRTGPEAGVQVPMKLFDYIRIGRPILAVTNRDSSAHWILSRSGIPVMYLFDDDTDAEIDEKLLTFFQWSTEPASPTPWFLRAFDGAEQVAELAALLTE